MDFSLSEEQELLRKTARDFLETECPKSVVREIEKSELGYSPDLWKKMAGLGWLGLPFPEEYGGVGGNLLDLAVLFEELGRAAFPSPMFSTIVLGSLPVLEAGNEQQKHEMLPKIAKGEVLLALALTEPEADYAPEFIATRARSSRERFVITGTKFMVQNAHTADYLLVVARIRKTRASGKGLTVFLVPRTTQGISLTPLKTISAGKQFEVMFDETPATSSCILGRPNAGWPVIESTLQKATAIQCVQMVGIAERALQMTAQYTSGRIQFGRPIATFQAVQQRLADMFTDVEVGRWVSYQAVWRLSEGLPAAREVAIAKAWMSNACQRVAFGAQHLHGGVGMDLDYDLQFYFRWAKALELNLGSAPVHLRALEGQLGL